MDRIKGYVVGIGPGNRSWRVRIRQNGHPQDGWKFIVASTHENITLAPGMNVSFSLGSFKQEPQLRAIDVMPDEPEAELQGLERIVMAGARTGTDVKVTIQDSGRATAAQYSLPGQGTAAGTPGSEITLVVTYDGHEVHVHFNMDPDWLRQAGSDEQIMDTIKVPAEGDPMEVLRLLTLISDDSSSNSILSSLELLLTAAYNAGVNAPRI